MSLPELKRQIDRLSADEQRQLESYLKAKRVADSPQFRTRIDAAHREIDAGRGLSSEAVRRLVQQQRPAAS